jgi:hypothetical protein
VRAFVVRLPRWREGGHGIDDEDDVLFMIQGFFESLVRGLLVPLVLVVLETPVAIVRGLLGRTGWVEASCRSPAEIRITWRTERRDRREIAAQVALRLERGYEGLTPEGAELVEMTKPPGADDLEV